MKKTLSLLFGLSFLALSSLPVYAQDCSASATSCTSKTSAHASFQQASFEAAQQTASQSDRPILIKVGTEWCKACNAFDGAAAENASVKNALKSNVVYVHVDAEKGEGIEVAKRYNVSGYPTFLLVNSDGDLLDQWSGFYKEAEWVDALETAVKDPITIDERFARFYDHATETDAAKLADIRLANGYYAEASALYQQAAYLNPKSKTNYQLASFKAVAKGSWKHIYNLDQVKAAADVVITANNSTGKDLMKVAGTMSKVASMSGESDLHVPYLKAAYEGTKNSSDESVQKYRTHMAADYALHVQKDMKKAVELKKENMPEGWTKEANQLNNFAWWCYQNKINMDEGEKMARLGVELAEAGTEKANILDTLAELCNAKGDCGESVELIQMAIAEDPANDYFATQLLRFQEQVAQQNVGD